ncbi:MAG: 3-oxoacyl-[acyl-carrier-protein] reductase [Deltaproteobacteria bacterium]|jgi:3-oxoacyl-[acyl-carrier protein] reductase|nr:3-oxoacyl-[acyl-carrier-protein] reductase [Deltaproteobacteria bacterium]MBW2477172.1 3-oxoacyl-[acyl-carrier-protein] reductase [Deltaproteobacteria bacterium]
MLVDKVAIITGASRGIGRAVACALAKQGSRVVVSARDAERLTSLVSEIEDMGGQAHAVVGDVSKSADADRLIDEAMGAFGAVDILINNAGVTRDGLTVRMKDEDWNVVLDTNLKGAFYCIRAALKPMSKSKSGRIINISSVVGEMGNAGQANYCASKAGLLGLTKSVAREMARRNITVNAITPGFIVTEMTDEMSDKAKQVMLSQIPLGKLGTVDDVAHSILFLASDEAGYITGQVLGVNGGMYM